MRSILLRLSPVSTAASPQIASLSQLKVLRAELFAHFLCKVIGMTSNRVFANLNNDRREYRIP